MTPPRARDAVQFGETIAEQQTAETVESRTAPTIRVMKYGGGSTWAAIDDVSSDFQPARTAPRGDRTSGHAGRVQRRGLQPLGNATAAHASHKSGPEPKTW